MVSKSLTFYNALLFILISCQGMMAQDLIIDGGVATNITSGSNLYSNTLIGDTTVGNSLTVQNTNTTLNNFALIVVGSSSSQNSLIVTAGAVAQGLQILVGIGTGSSNSLVVANGGTVNSANLWLGYQGASGSSAQITGSGSSLNVTSSLYIGDGSDRNNLTVSSGGKLITTGGAFIGLDSIANHHGSNNSVLISGAVSLWSNTGGLVIGQTGGGTVTLGSGATLNSDSIMIASSATSRGTLNLGSPAGANTNISLNASSINFGTGKGSLNFNQADTLLVTSPIISSTGSAINQTGSGTTILSGDNLNYQGDVTVSGGTLQVGTNGTNGPLGFSGKLTLTNNSSFVIDIDHDYSYTMSNAISGNGQLKNLGGGLLILAGNNTYAGVTLIQAVNCQCSGIQIGNGGTNGSLGQGTLILSYTNNNGTNFYPTIGFNRSDVYNVTNTIISGLGTIRQEGSGTTFLGGNTILYDPGASNGGTVFVDKGGLVLTGTLDGGTNGYIDVGTTNIPVTMSFLSNSITAMNSMIIGNGTLSGSNTVLVDHSTIGLAGVLSVGGANSPGGNTMVITNGAKVASTNLWVGAVSSSNTLVVTGTNTSLKVIGTPVGIYIGDGASGNSMIVSNGATVTTIGQAYIGTLTSFSGGTNPGSNNSVLITGTGSKWVNTDTVKIGDSGGGTVNISQGGSLTAGNGIVLAQSNTAVGTLNIGDFGKNNSAGTVTASTISFGSGSGTINFNQSNTASLSSIISGNGSVNQLGSGSSILSGNNTYTGTTTITNGTLVAASTNALGKSTVILNGGSLALQTNLTITSPFTWNSDATVKIPPHGTVTLIATSGVILSGPGLHIFDLTGSILSLIPKPIFNFGTNAFTTNLFGVSGQSTNYSLFTSNDILYVVGTTNTSAPPKPPSPHPPKPTPTPTPAPDYTHFAQNNNQFQLAKALNGFIGAGGDKAVITAALDNLDPSLYPAVFNAIMPTLYQSLSTIAFNTANSQNNDLIQRMSGIRTSENGDAVSGIPDNAPVIENDGKNIITPVDDKNPVDSKNPVSFKNPVARSARAAPLLRGMNSHWGMFVDLNGIYSQANSGNMLPNYNVLSGGGIAGPTYHWNENFTTGLYAGYEGSYVNYGGGSNLKDNGVRFGLFGTYAQTGGKGFYADALAGGGYHNYQVTRAINFPGISRTATSSPGASELDSMLAGGYDLKRGDWTFGPVVSAQYTYFAANAVNESGAQSLDFNSAGWQTSSLIGSLGGHVNYFWKATRDIAVVPQINLGWQHEFLQNPYNINGSLGDSPQFATTSSAPLRDTLYTGVGFTVNFNRKWNTSLFYNTSLGNSDLISQNIFWSAEFRF